MRGTALARTVPAASASRSLEGSADVKFRWQASYRLHSHGNRHDRVEQGGNVIEGFRYQCVTGTDVEWMRVPVKLGQASRPQMLENC
jgi:hypothetical protein